MYSEKEKYLKILANASAMWIFEALSGYFLKISQVLYVQEIVTHFM